MSFEDASVNLYPTLPHVAGSTLPAPMLKKLSQTSLTGSLIELGFGAPEHPIDDSTNALIAQVWLVVAICVLHGGSAPRSSHHRMSHCLYGVWRHCGIT